MERDLSDRIERDASLISPYTLSILFEGFNQEREILYPSTVSIERERESERERGTRTYVDLGMSSSNYNREEILKSHQA